MYCGVKRASTYNQQVKVIIADNHDRWSELSTLFRIDGTGATLAEIPH